MTDLVLDLLSWALLLGGGFFVLVGGVGVLRLPDLYTRMHAASLTDTMGALLILLGLMIQDGFTLVSFKLFSIMMLLLFSSPASAYAIANAAIMMGLKPLLAHDRTGAPKDAGPGDRSERP